MRRSLAFLLLFCLLFSLFSCSAPPVEEKTQEDTATLAETGKTQTEETKKEDDGILNLLLIGNSFCYYYVEELYGMLQSAGIQANVCNLYYSGCTVQQHWEWYRGSEANYTLYITGAEGRVGSPKITLAGALAEKDWDVISLQQHFNPKTALSYEDSKSSTRSYALQLYKMLKKKCPDATFYWQQSWAYEIGFHRPESGIYIDAQWQQTNHENIRKVCHEVAEGNEVILSPNGDAWAIARANPAIGDLTKDQYHDGETGGGQYLNACVWYEMLTGKSCSENTWRPDYELSEEKIAILQSAAHQAVTAIHGEDLKNKLEVKR